MLLKPDRKGTYIALAFGAVGLYAGIGGIVPGQELYLDEQGFRPKSFGKSRSAEWLEIAGFTPKRVRVGRREDVDVVEIKYQSGVGDRHVPQHRLGRLIGIDERYLVAAYGGLTNAQLAETLERYRTGVA